MAKSRALPRLQISQGIKGYLHQNMSSVESHSVHDGKAGMPLYRLDRCQHLLVHMAPSGTRANHMAGREAYHGSIRVPSHGCKGAAGAPRAGSSPTPLALLLGARTLLYNLFESLGFPRKGGVDLFPLDTWDLINLLGCSFRKSN